MLAILSYRDLSMVLDLSVLIMLGFLLLWW